MKILDKPWLWALLTLTWMGVIYALSDRPAGDFESTGEAVSWLPFATYVAHIGLYFILSLFVLRLLITLRRLGRGLIAYATVFTALVYGILDEIHQSNVEGRSSEIGDVVADVFGALLVVVIWFLQNRYRTFRDDQRNNSLLS